MNILHLTAGAGDMYCGSCLHSNTLAAALRAAGEDVLLVPLYTPIRTDEQSVSVDRVALGGMNAYLQQRFSLFHYAPAFVRRLLDHPRLLRWVSRGGWRTRPEHLGALTVSVLRGEQGSQRHELQNLIAWLGEQVRPEIVHLSNVLLAGLAHELHRQLRVPVVCTLSGEDSFLEKIPEPYYAQARALLRERTADLATLVAMNRYFAEFMADYLAVPRERIRVVRPGLNLAGHRAPEEMASAEHADKSDRSVFTIGYLARICPDKGLHVLADAWRLLCAERGLAPTHLLAAGYLDAADRPYLAEVRQRLADAGLTDRFRYVGELDRPAKIRFLQSLDLLCVPTVYRESKGLFALEAWASGVPAVLPAHGTFPELLAETGGGLLYEPNQPAALATALKQMIENPAFAADCGRQAQRVVHQRYSAARMARDMIELYREVCAPCRTY